MFRILFLALGSVILSLVLSEGSLRTAGWSAPLTRISDRQLGWRLRPHSRGYHRKENINFLELNEHGYNDTTYADPVPNDYTKIVFLGDSFTQAAEVPRDENFVSKTKEFLTADGLTNTRLFNLGVTGYNYSQFKILAKEELWTYNPDIVVLMSYLGNDIRDSVPELAESLKDERPYFSCENGSLRIAATPDETKITDADRTSTIINSSRILQLLKESYKNLSTGKAQAPKAQNLIYSPPDDQAWKKAWQRTECLIESIHSEVTSKGADFLLVIIPEDWVVNPQFNAGSVYAKSDFTYPSRRLANFTFFKGIQALDLTPGLRYYGVQHKEVLHGFAAKGKGHWNEQGHTRVAELLLPALRRLILQEIFLPPPGPP